MGWFSRIGNLIVNGNGAGEKILDAGINSIDALALTKEERLEYQQKERERWYQLHMLLAEKGSATSINRRLVAWAVLLATAFYMLLSVGIGMYTAWETPEVDALNILLNIMDTFYIGPAFVSIIWFYFGKHLFERDARHHRSGNE